jgi:hypothetical protein
MKRIKQAILGVAIGVCGPCFAQGFVNAYEVPLGVSVNVISNQLYHQNLNKTIGHWDAHEAEQKKKRAAAVRLPLAQTTGLGIAELTKQLPKEQAEAGRAAYKQAFDYHEQVIRKFGLPSGDLGVAIASAIAGAWMAYNNKPFPDEFYVPLVNQMRQRIGSSGAGLQSLSATERTTTYESLAVAGMILASSQITWQRNPRAAGAEDLKQRMRTQGGETLTRMLQVPPDRVGIGASGVYSLAAAGR